MYIDITVHYVLFDIRAMRGGSFPVNMSNFKKDEQREVIRVAYNFVEQIRCEVSERIQIQRILYNDKDVTELYKRYIALR